MVRRHSNQALNSAPRSKTYLVPLRRSRQGFCILSCRPYNTFLLIFKIKSILQERKIF